MQEIIIENLNGSRNIKSFLFNYMECFEQNNPNIKYADAFWGRFFEGLLFNEVVVFDKSLEMILRDVCYKERVKFVKLLKNNSVIFSKLFDRVMLTIKNSIEYNNKILNKESILIKDILFDTKKIYPTISESYFNKALQALELVEDLVIDQDHVNLAIPNNFEYHGDLNETVFACLSDFFNFNLERNGLNIEFIMDVIGSHGFDFFQVKKEFEVLSKNNKINVGNDGILYLSNATSFSEHIRCYANEKYFEKYKYLNSFNDLLKLLRNTNSENTKTQEDIFKMIHLKKDDFSKETTLQDIIKKLSSINIIIQEHNGNYWLETNMQDWCLEQVLNG